MTSIQFISVATNQEKITKICQYIQMHFDNKEKILIAVPSTEAANYLDNLLWKMPPESFLPHKIVETSSTASIIITTSPLNLNQAPVLFNLLPSVHPHYQDYKVIYEIFDATDPAKKEASQKKFTFYESHNHNLTKT